jgi:hypothetical protein
MPVSRIATRSARSGEPALYAARFGNTLGYSTGRSRASSGFEKYDVNCLSNSGGVVFQ